MRPLSLTADQDSETAPFPIASISSPAGTGGGVTSVSGPFGEDEQPAHNTMHSMKIKSDDGIVFMVATFSGL